MADTHTFNDTDRLLELVDGIRFAMLTTRVAGRLRARPMTTLDTDDAHRLWFLTKRDTELVDELRADPRVGLAYSDDGGARYVSVSGTATLLDDHRRVEQLWNPLLRAWFEDKDDPSIQLIAIDADAAEYWDGESNRLVRLAGIVRAAVTGDEYDAGEQGEIDLRTAARSD